MRHLLIFASVLFAAGFFSSAVAQSRLDDSAGIINNRSFTARILGGGDAEPGAYPSIVALVNRDFVAGSTPVENRFFCGGTLVAERWVLTAAHCVYNTFSGRPSTPGSIRIVGGIVDLAVKGPVEETRVVQIIIHPDYEHAQFDDLLERPPPNDLALMELESSTNATVATLFAGDTNDYLGSLGRIAGWGAIDDSDKDNPIYPTKLQDAVVPLVSDKTCNLPQSYNGSIASTHLCAGYVEGEIDACTGDSGGPLFINVDGVQIQAAITSFGVGCAQPNFYGIYTEVSYFIPWLSQYIPVPEQSVELVMRRASEALYPYAPVYNSRRKSGGSLGWLSLLVLLLFRRKPLLGACAAEIFRLRVIPFWPLLSLVFVI